MVDGVKEQVAYHVVLLKQQTVVGHKQHTQQHVSGISSEGQKECAWDCGEHSFSRK